MEQSVAGGLAHGPMLSPTVFDRETHECRRVQDRPLTRDIEQEGIRAVTEDVTSNDGRRDEW